MHLWLRHLWLSKCWGQESCPTPHCVFLSGHSRDWLLVQSLFPRMRYEVPVWHCDILFDNSQTIFLSFNDVIINSMSKIKGLQLKASILFSCHISWWMWSSHSTIAIENRIYLNTFSWQLWPCLKAMQHTSLGCEGMRLFGAAQCRGLFRSPHRK